MKRYAFLYNPAAGGHHSKTKLQKLRKHIDDHSNMKLYTSTEKGNLNHLIQQIYDQYDVFIACGGDGTILEVASSLVKKPKIMGIIPMGTGNDLCKTLDIPTNIDEAFALVMEGKSTDVDVGRYNNNIFLNTLGFGFDGLTNSFAQNMRYLPSFFRYAVASIKAAAVHQKFMVEIENQDQSSQKELIMVTLANGRVEGGTFWIAPTASITDGQLDLVMVHPISKWLIPILLPFILFRKPHWIPHLHSKKVNTINLVFKRDVKIHCDGEIINPKEREFSITVLQGALNVICRT